MCQRILWIEDDHRELEDMVLPLKRKGYQFDIAENYIKAVNCIKTGSYDLILLDLIIPVGKDRSHIRSEDYEPNGFKILRLLRENEREIPTIVFSVVEDEQMLDYLAELGVRKYLKKGITSPELLESEISSILARKD